MKLISTSPKSLLARASRRGGNDSAGYILITLILIVALLTIAAAAIAPSIAFQVKRDREEEMIHRGVQYSRAVQHYYKKFNRYPSRIEDLEDTNNLRFLRKKYKDPITGKDFKLVHLSEAQMALAGGGGLTPAANSGPGTGSQSGQSANTNPANPGCRSRRRDQNRQTHWGDLWWRTNRGGGEHKQSAQHPRIQQERSLQRVALCL